MNRICQCLKILQKDNSFTTTSLEHSKVTFTLKPFRLSASWGRKTIVIPEFCLDSKEILKFKMIILSRQPRYHKSVAFLSADFMTLGELKRHNTPTDVHN